MAVTNASCGQSVAPVAENGHLPCMRPSCPYDIATKPKSATVRNAASMSEAAIFLDRESMYIYYNTFAFRRRELETTETLENAIASPANTGLKSHPKNG